MSKPLALIVGVGDGLSASLARLLAREGYDLVLAAQPLLAKEAPDLQFVHLTGAEDFEKVRAAWEKSGQRAVVLSHAQVMRLRRQALF